MSGMEDCKKSLKLFVATLIICAVGVSTYVMFAQPPHRTDEIYVEALDLYNKKEYSRSYFKFSKIIFASQLKPLAIYHQGICAEKVDDINGAIKKYNLFLTLYPKHILATRVKYNLAQILIEKEPSRAKKYFENIIKNQADSDYAIASEYYAGLIDLKKYQKEKIFPLSAKQEIESHFRHYLKKAPGGRLALNVISNWSSIDNPITKDDYLLIAKSYYLFGNYEKASEYASKAELKNAWPLEVKIAAAMNNKARVEFLTEWGLQGNAEYVDKEDVYSSIDTYMGYAPSKYQTAIKLIGLTKSRGKDYLMDIKCRYSPAQEKPECYKNLYLWYPTSDFVDDAQSQIFLHLVRANDTINAQRLGTAFLNKYKTSEYVPMVMYYMGRLSENTKAYREYMSYYKSVISKFPDNYYAYRAYLHLNHSRGPLITSFIKEQPIEFPYERKHDFLEKLVTLKDFEVLEEYYRYDDFIKSWVLYKKGDTKQAMVVARDAMEKLNPKPDRRDLRWRLVYPVMFYDEFQNAANKTGNVAPLMLSIAREESYFDPQALSSVGAKGLMQLMPATASEVASNHSISGYNLLKPEDNIKLGNYYYAQLRSLLGGLDVSSIAAYNGGIGSVNNWKSSIYYQETDSFIEQIPYPETKNYVKKVLRTYWNYVRIYNGN